MPRLVLVLAAVTLGACAAGTPPSVAQAPVAMAAPKPAALNPVGLFEFNTEVNGSPMKGNLSVTGSAGSYTGKMSSDITPELPATSVSVEGQTMKVMLETPNGAATINLVFTGETFTGNWELGGTSGPLSGKRIK